jgi:hypothetical protein
VDARRSDLFLPAAWLAIIFGIVTPAMIQKRRDEDGTSPNGYIHYF